MLYKKEILRWKGRHPNYKNIMINSQEYGFLSLEQLIETSVSLNIEIPELSEMLELIY